MLATGTINDVGVSLAYATTSTGSWSSLGILFEFGSFEFMMDSLNATNHGAGGKTEKIPGGLMDYSPIPVTVHASETNANFAWDTMEDETIYWWQFTQPTKSDMTNPYVFQAVMTKGSIPTMIAESPKVFKLQFTLEPVGDVTGIGA